MARAMRSGERPPAYRWLWLLAAVALAACTDAPPAEPSPSPSVAATEGPTAEPTGLRVGIVLPQATVRPIGPDAVRAAVGDLRVDTRDDVREYRVLQPDGPEFTADLVALLADEGYDLVCAVGPGAAAAVLPVAADHPEIRFCATPAAPVDPTPANVHLIDVRADHAAYVAGAAAAEGISPPPALDDEAPSALTPGIVGDPTVLAAEPQTSAFVAGLRRRVTRDIEVTFGVPDADERSTAEQTRFILEAGGEVVFGSAGASTSGLLEGAAEAGGLVVALVDPRAPIAEPPATLLATVGLDLHPALEAAVLAVLQGDDPTPVRLGAAEGVVTVDAGAAGRAAQAVAAARAALDDLAVGRVTLP